MSSKSLLKSMMELQAQWEIDHYDGRPHDTATDGTFDGDEDDDDANDDV